MKTTCWVMLGMTLAFGTLAQPATPSFHAPATPSEQTVRPPLAKATLEKIERMPSIFDGRTLDGWIQTPPSAVTFSGDDIIDLPALVERLSAKQDPVSQFINDQLDEAERMLLAEFSPDTPNARAVRSALARTLNRIVSGPSVYTEGRFQSVRLRAETIEFQRTDPRGLELARLNRLFLEDAFPAELWQSPDACWTVREGAMSSLGVGRGVIRTAAEYSKFRIIFTMRHLGGPPADHAPCVLIFCTAPPEGERGLDALGGIQFQPPNGGSWDYRPGKNNSGRGLFTRLVNPGFNSREWHQVELLVDAEAGTARMAVAQPVGARAVEVLTFKDPTAGKTGPIAWQMHNKGLFDEFKDIRIEENPTEDRLILCD